MYYEIKEDINVIGLTSTYVLINRLNIDILVCAIHYYMFFLCYIYV